MIHIFNLSMKILQLNCKCRYSIIRLTKFNQGQILFILDTKICTYLQQLTFNRFYSTTNARGFHSPSWATSILSNKQEIKQKYFRCRKEQAPRNLNNCLIKPRKILLGLSILSKCTNDSRISYFALLKQVKIMPPLGLSLKKSSKRLFFLYLSKVNYLLNYICLQIQIIKTQIQIVNIYSIIL